MNPPSQSEPSLDKKAEALINKYAAEGITLEKNKIISQIKENQAKFNYPTKFAAQSFEAQLHEQYPELDCLGDRKECKERLVNEFTHKDQWGDITVKINSRWEEYNEDVQNIGLVEDISGKQRFILFEATGKQDLVEGEIYHITNVVTKRHNDELNLKITKNSSITHLTTAEYNIFKGSQVEGRIIRIIPMSGLVMRCSHKNCSRVLSTDNECPEHGLTQGDYDLRIKAILSDGSESTHIVFDQDQTEELLGMTLDEAVEKGKGTAMDIARQSLRGQPIRASLGTVTEQSKYEYVESYQMDPPTDRSRIDDLLIKTRDIKHAVA